MSDDAIVTKEKVEEYLALTSEASAKATPCAQGSEDEARLETMMRMCDDYAADARHFMESGDLLRAFGAINYSHAWLDAAVRIGLLNGHGDDRLFTLPSAPNSRRERPEVTSMYEPPEPISRSFN